MEAINSFFDWLFGFFEKPSINKTNTSSKSTKTSQTNVPNPSSKVNPRNSSMLVMGHSGNVGAGNWSEVLGTKYNMKVINIAIGGKQSADDLKALKQYFFFST